MSFQTVWDGLRHIDWGMWAMLGLLLWIAGWMVAGVVAVIIDHFKEFPARQRVKEFLRLAGLLAPGILFLVWSPHGLFSTPGDQTVKLEMAWLAWPILCYYIGHNDGKKEVQRKLDEEDARRREQARKV
jgi:hypothetical protein